MLSFYPKHITKQPYFHSTPLLTPSILLIKPRFIDASLTYEKKDRQTFDKKIKIKQILYFE